MTWIDTLANRRWPWLLAAAVVLLVFLSTFVEIRLPVSRGDPRPVGSIEDIEALRDREDLNLLFVLIDTLRADRMGLYGYERDTSPEMERIAARGVHFGRHLAQSSWTKCSMTSLWTGLYPQRTGVTRYDEVIPDEARLPAEILKDAGFRTVGIFRNGWVSPSFGFDQGFDVYIRPTVAPIPPSVRRENPTLTSQGTDQDVITSALEFLRVRGDERWFLYLHLMDVHEFLYDEETAQFGGSISDVYDNSVLWTDQNIRILLDELTERGFAENTLVVIASDHGEAFLERGLEGHARNVFKETTEVPLVFSFPFQLEPGLVVDARTRNVDIWPTILDLLGLDDMGDTDGRSLLPVMRLAAQGEPLPELTGIAHLDQTWGRRGTTPKPTVSVSEGPLRYVRVLNETDSGAAEYLFDANEDPRELTNLSRKDPDTTARLRALADQYLEQEPAWGTAPSREINEMELNQLRALGYAIP